MIIAKENITKAGKVAKRFYKWSVTKDWWVHLGQRL